MEESKTGEWLKRWMQALALAAVLWIWPVSVLWEGPEEPETESVSDTGTVEVSVKEAEERGKEKEEKQEGRETAPENSPAPAVALTFDDGPDSQYTPFLLDGLKERGVKATFFVIGENIEKDGNEKILKRMEEEGHLIGNHTYHHVNLSELSRGEARKELEMTDRLIAGATGKETFLVRPPFGEFPGDGEEDGKLYVKWTVDSSDWVTKNTEQIVRKVVTDTEENDIILMHDCYRTSVEAALIIVDLLQEKGYEFVTLDRLLMQ